MPRGTRLSSEEESSASALSDAGFSVKKTAAQLGRSRCVIAAYLQDPDHCNTRNAQERPRRLSSRQQREIWRKVSNSTKSLSGICAELSLSVLRTTIWRTIKRNGNIERAMMRRAEEILVAANNKQYRTMKELRLAVVQAGDAIEPGMLENLANTMPSRLFELISGQGGPISY
ncbi:hypothetical protein OESDEN_15242 [Oesophagostomum dentatum]|uniref:Transposable element Tc3 transposase-like DNA-binding HTH domain-containing protein n=1 Tax=Oesophagostomum dentatum TaxID=61180 RepID=A0A0B1SNF2_OESDE|nr:hypothetical protein OESDEN_15242 [Oesophagostomum dentatum]